MAAGCLPIKASFLLVLLLHHLSISSLAGGGGGGRDLLTFSAASKKKPRGQPIPNCREIASRAECERSSKWCRWCRSEALDDMCFGAYEAWRLPSQVFSCDPSH